MTDIPEVAVPATSPPAEVVGSWEKIKEALRGAHHDYTDGPIGRAIFLLAVPMVLETVLESVFAVVDVFFVSRLGADAVATVGLTESMMVLIYTLAMGLGIGATATVARRIGDRDAGALARECNQHFPRTDAHLRSRPVSTTGGRRCSGGHQHWPRYRRDLRPESSRPSGCARSCQASPLPFRSRADVANGAFVGLGNVSDSHGQRELGRTCPNRRQLRQQRARRLYDRYARSDVCAAS